MSKPLNDFEIYKAAIQKFGSIPQILVAVEELAELQKELLKNVNRKKNNRNEIIEEIADVQIMLDQLKIIFGITDRELLAHTSLKLMKLDALCNS